MRIAPVILVSLLAAPAPVWGQTAARHQGFWIGLGVGGGSDFSPQASGARSGAAGYLRLGGTPTPRLLLGGEASFWGRRRNGVTVSRLLAAGTVSLYPTGRGLCVRGGVGFAAVTLEAGGSVGTVTLSNEGVGGILGGGYDVQLDRNLFLTPNLDFMVQVIDGDATVVGLLTVGLTWH